MSTGDELLDWTADKVFLSLVFFFSFFSIHQAKQTKQREKGHNQIMDSNRPMLKAAIEKRSPHSKIIDGGMIPDSLDALREFLFSYSPFSSIIC